MKSYLKTDSFTLPDGEVLPLVELSAGGRMALSDLPKDKKGHAALFVATAVWHGVPSWRSHTPEEIALAQPDSLLGEICTRVLKLSGISSGDEAAAEKN